MRGSSTSHGRRVLLINFTHFMTMVVAPRVAPIVTYRGARQGLIAICNRGRHTSLQEPFMASVDATVM